MNHLTKFLKSQNLVQTVNKATHLDGNILDHVCVPKEKCNKIQVNLHYTYYSDHEGISVSFKKDTNE